MEIPGYKWDPENNRYFKVLSTGQQPGGEYTVARVAERDREFRRSIVRGRAQALTEDAEFAYSQGVLSPQTDYEFSRLGSRSRKVYTGGSDELISSIHVTPRNELVTGSRTGVIAFNGSKSGPGRSIIGISEVCDTPVAAAVDNESGSTVATASAAVHLVQDFVTSLTPVDRVLAIGSQRGVSIWDVSHADSLDALPLGSVTALASPDPHTVLAGTKSGDLEVLDLRTCESQSSGQVENRRSITNLGVFYDSIVATGLEDQMWLYDVRNLGSPVLQFAGYENWSTAKHGFAVRDTAVAVALDNGAVRVFDGITGHSPGLAWSATSEPPVPALVWTQDGLFVAKDNAVVLKPGHLGVAEATSSGVVGRIHRALNLI